MFRAPQTYGQGFGPKTSRTSELRATTSSQVLFHCFYYKKSFVRFNVKRVAASCVLLASKQEETPRKAGHVLNVFHRMECRKENLPVEHLDSFSEKYSELKMDLVTTERYLLKDMGSYAILHTTLCVQFKSEVIACGVIYAVARRFNVLLPKNPP
ncbi:hypothetical protein LguiA_002563 [Lonicera macranthoides]